MRSHESGCFTRVVIDGDQDIELAELKLVMQRIDAALTHLATPVHRRYLSTALLNLAVCHLLRERGVQNTATTLIRLIDAVLEHGEQPSLERPVSLTSTHS